MRNIGRVLTWMLVLMFTFVLPVVNAGQAMAQAAPPNTSQAQAINDAIQLLRNSGLDGIAANVESYLDKDKIEVDPSLPAGTNGETLTGLGLTIYINPDLFDGYGDGDKREFESITRIATTLAHEKVHAEEQDVVAAMQWSFTHFYFDTVDYPEVEANLREFLVEAFILHKLNADFRLVRALYDVEYILYNGKVSEYNALELPDKALIEDMLHDVEKLLEKLDEMLKLLDRMIAVLTVMSETADGLRWQGYDEEKASKVTDFANEWRPQIDDLTEEAREEVARLTKAKEELEARDPPLEYLKLIEPIPPEMLEEAGVMVQDMVAEASAARESLLQAQGSEKFGPVKPYFDELAKRVVNGTVNINLDMMGGHGYHLPSPFIIGMVVEDGVVLEVTEKPYDFPLLRISTTQKGVIDATKAGDVATALDTQLNTGQVIIEAPFVEAFYEQSYQESQEELSRVSDTLDDVERQLTDTASRLESTQSQLDDLKEKYGQLEQENTELIGKLESTRNQLSELEKKYEQLKPDNAELTSRVASLESRLSLASRLNYVLGATTAVFLAIGILLYIKYNGSRGST